MIVNTEQLKHLLAENARVSEAEASAFVDALAGVVIAHLREGEEVTIQGIGVFSVVGLRQGETRRVAFIPDEKMKANVNSPFSCFEPVVIGNVKEAAPIADGLLPSQELKEEDESEPVAAQSEAEAGEALAQSGAEATGEAEAQSGAEAIGEALAQSEPESETEPETEPEAVEEQPETVVASTEAAEPVIHTEPVVPAEPAESARPAEEPGKNADKADGRKRKEERKPSEGSDNKVVYISLGAVVVACVALLFFIFSGPSDSDMERGRQLARQAIEAREDTPSGADLGKEASAGSMPESQTSQAKPEDAKPEDAKAVDVKIVDAKQVETKPDATRSESASAAGHGEVPASKASVDYDKMRMKDASGQYVTTKLEPGERLTLLALRHFGDKAFWAYIYDVNADHVKGPNSVEAGKTLYLPDPKYFGIDSTDVNSLKRARQRGHDLLKQSAGQ